MFCQTTRYKGPLMRVRCKIGPNNKLRLLLLHHVLAAYAHSWCAYAARTNKATCCLVRFSQRTRISSARTLREWAEEQNKLLRSLCCYLTPVLAAYAQLTCAYAARTYKRTTFFCTSRSVCACEVRVPCENGTNNKVAQQAEQLLC